MEKGLPKENQRIALAALGDGGSWQEFMARLSKRGFSEAEIEYVGLVISDITFELCAKRSGMSPQVDSAREADPFFIELRNVYESTIDKLGNTGKGND